MVSLLLGSALGGAGLIAPVVATDHPVTISGHSTYRPDPGPDARRSGGPAASRPPPGRVVAVYPNPVAEDDVGEYVHLTLSGPGNWTVGDGEGVVALPGNVSGAVLVLAGAPAGPVNPGTVQVLAGPDSSSGIPAGATLLGAPSLSLANAGEALVLRHEGRVVDRVAYREAPEGDRYLPGAGWRPLGLVPREAARTGPATATAFVLPDSPGVAGATIEAAGRRVLLAGYTLSSRPVVDALLGAHRRGVEVRVLLESAPVGGRSRREAAALDRLVAAGVDVRVLGGPRDRFAYHHAKYAVVDDAALVLTENWKPAGVGGRSSRGWGVLVRSPAVASELAAVFAHDAGWRDAIPWERHRRGRSFDRIPPAEGDYPTRFEPRRVSVRAATVLTTPGNAEPAMVGLIENASTTVDVVQPTVARDSELLWACLRAAQRGVRVRLLLSGAWYVAEENARVVDWLAAWAERTGAPLEARLAEPRDRFEKIHAKGLVVDDRVTVVGSLNWNPQAAAENREVLVALHGPEPAAYFGAVFESDWRAGGRTLPVGLLAGVGVAAVGAVLLGRRTIGFVGSNAGGRAGGSGEGARRGGGRR